MRYVTKNGEAYEMLANSRRTGPVILSCAIGAAVGIGFRLVFDLNPGIVVGVLSAIRAIAMAIWDMLGGAAHAIAEFVRYVLHSRH